MRRADLSDTTLARDLRHGPARLTDIGPLALPAAYLRDGLTLALLCLVSFITGSAFVFLSIAEQSSIKQVVGGGQLNRALAVTLVFVRYRAARRLTLAALAWRSRGSDLDQVR